MSCHIFLDDYHKSLLWLCGRYDTFLCVFICCMHYWNKSVTKPKYFKCVKQNITCFVVLQYSTTKRHRIPIRQHTHLISHAGSYEIEEVFKQARVVLSVQVCQWSLLSDWSIRIQFCDQRPAETTAGLIPPQLQGMERVFPTHEQFTINDLLDSILFWIWDIQ